METIHFNISVDCNLHTNENEQIFQDNGVLLLPDSYQENGKPTRLVINCHGAGGSVSTDDSQARSQVITQYLLANGYAVMDVNGLPDQYAKINNIDIHNNIGSPIAVRSYVNAYRYCVSNYNLYSEVFVHGASMGGISSTNLVLSGLVPVIAHTAFCPVLDTYNEIFLHPWSGGLPKFALGKIYGLEKDENGDYIYDEDKIMGYNPAKNPKIEHYPVPVKFWHCEDDPIVSINVTWKFIDKIVSCGGEAHLRTFENGGHEPQLFGAYIENPCGNILFKRIQLKITPAVEEVFNWIKKFD